MPTTFTPSCTLPSEGTNFVSSPPVRGTLDILWSCLSIFVLCTWSVYRPSVPSQAEPQNKKQMFRKQLYLLRRQMMFALRMLFIPEVEIASAGVQLLSALDTSKYAKRMKEGAWTLADSFLLDMGGIAVHFPDQMISASAGANTTFRNASTDNYTTMNTSDHELRTLDGPATGLITGLSPEDTPFESDWRELLKSQEMENESMGPNQLSFSAINQYLVKMVVEKLVRDKRKPHHKWWYRAFVLQYDSWILNGRQNCYLKDVGIIEQIPRLSMGALAAQNRGSILVKALAVLQVLWLITQILVRAHKDLPSTQLEILTLAYAVSAFFIYLLLWEKPQDVMTITRVDACRTVTVENIEALISQAPTEAGPTRKTPWMSTLAVNVNASHYLATSMGSLVFGAVHLAAWNFVFPTTIERWLWRISSLITTGLPLITMAILGLVTFFMERLPESWESWDDIISATIVLIIAPAIYVAARLFIMVEAFRTLGFLSTETFQSTWAANVPHVG